MVAQPVGYVMVVFFVIGVNGSGAGDARFWWQVYGGECFGMFASM
jgi:hypothetical protein